VRVVLNSCSGRLWLRVIIAEDAVCSSSDEGHDALIELFNQRLLIPEEAAPQFLDDVAPRNGMMPPPDSEMISPPITE